MYKINGTANINAIRAASEEGTSIEYFLLGGPLVLAIFLDRRFSWCLKHILDSELLLNLLRIILTECIIDLNLLLFYFDLPGCLFSSIPIYCHNTGGLEVCGYMFLRCYFSSYLEISLMDIKENPS